MPATRRAATASALGLWLLAAPAVAQDAAADLAALEQSFDADRLALRQVELLARYRELDATVEDERDHRTIAARIAALTVEIGVLSKAEPWDQLRVRPPARIAALVAPTDKNAEEELAFAAFCFRHGEVGLAEDALGRARDRDAKLRDDTDRMLAEARGEPVPRGGYHRYRGVWLPLERRDTALAIDTALAHLRDLGVDGAAPPFAPDDERSNLERFTALGDSGPIALRAACEAIRTSLRADYAVVRGWLSSYARFPKIRSALLEAVAAMAPVRGEALELIGRYSKLDQPAVDDYRARLERMYADYRSAVARDRANLDRVTEAEAWALSERIDQRERALGAVDEFLKRQAPPGLEPATIRPEAGAEVGVEHRLPGRVHSELEDVLWLLLRQRAGRVRDVLDRATELRRHLAALTPWEAWLSEELLADAVEQFNARVASSLDRVERDFVAVVNGYRRVLGLRPFEIEERCNQAARKHSREMVDLGYFGHVSPIARNRTPTDRVRLEGYSGGVGENCLVGGGAIDGRGAFEAWYHSPGHHRNLVSGGIHLGTGAADGHRMWTMVAGGADLAWRGLHRDLSPGRRAVLDAAADEFALAWRKVDPSRLEQQRQEAARRAVLALLPDVLPRLAERGFAAIGNPREPDHPAAPHLLRAVVDAEVGVEWRALQVAAVSALIDGAGDGATSATRRAAFDGVRALLTDAGGYSVDARTEARRDAVLALRRDWEDVAQWRYRRAGAPPEAPRIAGHSGDGPSLDAPLRVLAKPERLRLAKRFGGGTRTEQAVERALDWLARVQDDDGAWRARSFVLRSPAFDARTAGLGGNEFEIAMTGLALLAYSTSGHTLDQGDHRETVRQGCDFLLQSIVDYGKFDTIATHYMYSHAIATQALCELYAYGADPRVGQGAQLALDFLAWAQHRPSGGWRYDSNQHGDTSVVGWVVMALNAGHKARLDVTGFRDALRFVESVTQPGYYQVGYTHMPGLGGENKRLTAVGMVSRLFLGQSPETPAIALPSWRLLDSLPDRNDPDFYYWYYASIALFQRGGKFWERWNEALSPALLALQVDDRASPYHGSWPPDRHHGGSGGRIYATALGVLILTTYYRYDRAPKIKLHPFTGDLAAVAAEHFAAVRDGDPRLRDIALSKMLDELGPSIVPELARRIGDGGEPIEFRKRLAEGLVTVVQPFHEALLLPLLAAGDGHIVEHTARALVSVGSPHSLPALVAALDHGSARVRTFAAEALGRIADARAVAPLSARVEREPDGGAKNAQQAALRRLAHRGALATAIDTALGTDTTDRLAIVEGLDLLEQAGLGERLAACATREPALFDRCTAAIRVHRATAAIPLLIELLDSDDLDTRREAIKLLRALTGVQIEFDENAAVRDRRAAIERWRAWHAARS